MFGNTEIGKHKFHFNKHPNFLKDVVIDNIFIPTKTSFSKKNYKCFIGYLEEHKIKPFSIIIPKTSVYVISYDVGKNGCIFQLKIRNYKKNIMIFGIKSAIVWKKNVIGNPCTIKNFWKPICNLTAMSPQIFMIKKFVKWAVIALV